MTRAQIEADLGGLYPPFSITPWLVLANGNAVFLNDDRVLATAATPPKTLEVLWLMLPPPSPTWPYSPTAGFVYPGTYVCVDREVVWQYIDECGGVIGVVDAAQSPDRVRADVRAHFPEQE